MNQEKQTVKAELVAAVLLEQHGAYLLVQEKKPKAYGLWNLPAGHVDVGESFEEAALREAKEETGLTVQIVSKIGIYQQTPKEAVKHVYLARVISGTLTIPEDELLDAKWLQYEEILAMRSKLRNPWVLEAIEAFRKCNQ